jgi:hypothetical protein
VKARDAEAIPPEKLTSIMPSRCLPRSLFADEEGADDPVELRFHRPDASAMTASGREHYGRASLRGFGADKAKLEDRTRVFERRRTAGAVHYGTRPVCRNVER